MSDDHTEGEQIGALNAEVSIGFDAQAFKQSAIGRYLIERAREAIIDACTTLRNVNPFDGKAVANAQLDARAPELLIVWIEEAIEGGKAAASMLHQRESSPVDPV